MRLTRNHAVHFSNKAATITRRPRLINSEHAQSVEVIVGVVMGQKVVRLKPDRPYRLLRLCNMSHIFLKIRPDGDWMDNRSRVSLSLVGSKHNTPTACFASYSINVVCGIGDKIIILMYLKRR